MDKVIIVGGGIVGMTAAYLLAKDGCDVTVIDRKERGQATDAAAGVICPWLSKRRNKAWYALASGGARFYEQLVFDLSRDTHVATGYRKAGALAIREHTDVLYELADKACERRKDAPEIGEVDVLTPEETKNYFPLIADSFAAVYVSGGARADGRMLRQALEKGAQGHGARYIQDTAILHRTADRVDGVVCLSSGLVIHADQIILAAGAWAADLLAPIGFRTDVLPQKGQLLHVTLPDMCTENWPVVLPPGSHDIVPFPNGRIVIGATHEKTEDGFDLRPTAGGVLEVLTDAVRFAPGLKEAAISVIRVGTRPYTPDYSPFIGQVPGYPSLWMANGFGSSGLTAGPFAGWLLAKKILGEETPVDLKPYDPSPYLHNL
ncbi:FAD-binding oxidoreductase [Sporolactobacillus sp. THM7-4]|nr:FAD-binding oxidoreductase [Sporolactobacillus sp. THM7-4]